MTTSSSHVLATKIQKFLLFLLVCRSWLVWSSTIIRSNIHFLVEENSIHTFGYHNYAICCCCSSRNVSKGHALGTCWLKLYFFWSQTHNFLFTVKGLELVMCESEIVVKRWESDIKLDMKEQQKRGIADVTTNLDSKNNFWMQPLARLIHLLHHCSTLFV